MKYYCKHCAFSTEIRSEIRKHAIKNHITHGRNNMENFSKKKNIADSYERR